MPARRACIALDLTLPQAGLPAGWQSLAERLAESLIRQTPEVDFLLISYAAQAYAVAHLNAPNARLMVVPERGGRSLLHRMQRRLRRSRVGRVFSGARIPADVLVRASGGPGVAAPRVPVVGVVHDLQHVTHPHLLTSSQRVARAQAFDGLWRQASGIVCPTPGVRQVVLDHTTLAPTQVQALALAPLLLGPPGELARASEVLAQHRLRHRAYLLLAADFEPRHNHRLVLTALGMHRAAHPQCDLTLVCTGAPGAGEADTRMAAERMGLAPVVTFVGELTPEQRIGLVQSCQALLVPSLYETVGEVVATAVVVGRPVVCSRTADLAELLDGAALSFDPHRPADLTQAFERLECDPQPLPDEKARTAHWSSPRDFVDAVLSVASASH